MDLEVRRRDDQLFLAPQQIEIAVGVETADIAGGDAVRGDKGGFVLAAGALEIFAGQEFLAVNDDLAVFLERDGDAVQRLSNRSMFRRKGAADKSAIRLRPAHRIRRAAAAGGRRIGMVLRLRGAMPEISNRIFPPKIA